MISFFFSAVRTEGKGQMDMYEKCTAHLKMLRMILEGGSFIEGERECRVITYNQEEECIYLLVEEGELTSLSLDGIYECEIKTQKETVRCKGRLIERYMNKMGKIAVMRVKNGFYKNNVN